VLNNGCAPFYYDWPLQLAALSESGSVVKTYPVDWKLTAIEPSTTPRSLKAALLTMEIPKQSQKLALRVINPLPNGKPLKFANAEQDADAPGWLTLGKLPD